MYTAGERATLENRLFPTHRLDDVIQKNRHALRQIDRWIDDEVYATSVFRYGLPEELRHLIDCELGDEPTYADAMLCLAPLLPQPVNYLEIGVSVGKTFWQMMNGLPNGNLTGVDIEDLSPRLSVELTRQEEASWQGPKMSMRRSRSRDIQFSCSQNCHRVRYLAADVFDESAWERLKGESFNLVFSDAFHSAEALYHEAEMWLKYDLIDLKSFVLVWDDLNGAMLHAFESIAECFRRRLDAQRMHHVVVRLRGWLGMNWGYHSVGFLIHLPDQAL